MKGEYITIAIQAVIAQAIAPLCRQIEELSKQAAPFVSGVHFRNKDLKEAIYNVMGVSFDKIAKDSRNRWHVLARMIYAHYCKERGENTLYIAEETNHDISTICYYLRNYYSEYKYNRDFKAASDKVKALIYDQTNRNRSQTSKGKANPQSGNTLAPKPVMLENKSREVVILQPLGNAEIDMHIGQTSVKLTAQQAMTAAKSLRELATELLSNSKHI